MDDTIYPSKWVEVGKSWYEWHDYDVSDDERMPQVGMEIEVRDKDNGKLYRKLVGEINRAGGVCDDCRDFNFDSVVVRYRWLVDPKLLECE